MNKIYWKIYGIISITLSAAGIITNIYDFDPYVLIGIPGFFSTLIVCFYAFDVVWKTRINKRSICIALIAYTVLYFAWTSFGIYMMDIHEISALSAFATTLVITILDSMAIWRYGIARPSQGQDAQKANDFPDTMVI